MPTFETSIFTIGWTTAGGNDSSLFYSLFFDVGYNSETQRDTKLHGYSEKQKAIRIKLDAVWYKVIQLTLSQQRAADPHAEQAKRGQVNEPD